MNVDFTRRERQIIKVLLEGQATTERLSRILGVSRRTIIRDLPGLSEKLKPFGIKLNRKSGKGINLEGERESLERLKQEVERVSESVKITPDERQKLIVLFLLENKEPQKLYSFAREFGVTEATISNDLDKVEEVLSKYGLKLARRPGLGVWIKGPEKSIRHLITELFYEYFDEVQLVRLIKDNLQGSMNNGDLRERIKNRFFGFIEKNWLEGIEGVLKETMEENGMNLADSAYAGLLVHIALALERLKNGEVISMDGALLSTLKGTKEFELAARLAARMESAFGVKIPEDELGYITMHLLGAKLRTGDDDFREFFAMDHREAVEASLEILKEAGRELKRDLVRDARVVEDLALHLKPALVRMKMGMEIRNPILSQIKDTYPDLMKVAKKAARVLEKKFGVAVPEAEIGYIAMHIGAALERERKRTGVVLVCPSGIGSARMLASRLKKELPDLEILDVVSLLDLEGTLAKHPDTEAIISTVPLEVARLPVIVVSPLLPPEDVENIRTFVKERTFSEPEGKSGKKESDGQKTSEEIAFELLEGFLVEEVSAESLEKLLDAIEEKIKSKPGVTSAPQVKRDIYERELKVGTAVPGMGISVLHARTSGVEKPFLGLFRLQKPLKMKNMDNEVENVKACLVMLLPQKSSPREMEMMGRISAALVEDKNLSGTFKYGTGVDVIKSLLRILK
ncbi:MAG: mannitol operon transcriptional activator [Tepidanaerobacteraceae bacterium]|nr:mannitol operon transcriptional activator [Tepidanaerobacteraceae bacterium]